MNVRASFRRFAGAKHGLAAVEFALLAPMMIVLLFGSIEIIDALGANRRAQNVASSLADVTARDTEISGTELTGLWAATNILMFPESGRLDVRLTSVTIQSATVASVFWSEQNNGFIADRSDGSRVTLPAAMMVPGSSVIMAETVYNYTPPLAFLFPAATTMRHTAYRRSRVVDPIPRV